MNNFELHPLKKHPCVICKNFTDSINIQDKFKSFVQNLTIFKVPLKSLLVEFQADLIIL